jgi:hypothetical protein
MNPLLVILGIILLALIALKERILVILMCCVLILASILWAA